MITLIDYGVGNIFAFQNVYKRLNIPTKIAKTQQDLADAKKMILPGVGSFDYAMGQLNASGMREKLDELVLEKKVPVIGICVGMQMLAKTSEEGVMPGLGWINATVKKIDTNLLTQTTRLPHMGWNDVSVKTKNPLLKNLEFNSRFYFLHSYYFETNLASDSIAFSNYGKEFTCVVNHKNIYGVQFHPESVLTEHGHDLLNNFLKAYG